ncbi:hypothetical protein, partial [Salisediminibacterium halotolerans]|uniref:hypothetical protein n=1 Tax=Salisediminibacterium halotolerans TaxID=517425 RepID=UPI001C42F8D1
HRVNVRIEKTMGVIGCWSTTIARVLRKDRLPPRAIALRGQAWPFFSAGVSRVFRQQPSEVIIYEFRGERNALEELS